VRDAVNTVLAERQALERGFGGSLLLSGFGHGFLLAGLVIVSLMPPPTPRMDVIAFAVPLPRGGGGVPEPPPPQAPKPEPKAEAPPAPKPAEILKPPKSEPSRALPDPNDKKPRKVERTPEPRVVEPPDAGPSRAAAAGALAQAPGFDLTAPPGAGTPTGVSSGGDFYLASVQQRILTIWRQQVRGDQTQTVSVVFTILADGSVTDVEVSQPSGVALLDLAAKRAVLTAAPFRPLPRNYATDRFTLQANFKPTL
jgi:periplasmic protein TonB